MNKNIIVLGFCFISFFAFSQSGDHLANVLENKNELKINGLYFILGAIEVDYQYLINEESGVGIDALYAFSDEDLSVNYYISPYYRQYFGKKPASGFFVEGFGMLNSIKEYYYYSYDQATDTYTYNGGFKDSVVDFALGIGIGVKFLTIRNFVLEIDLGIGRNLFKNDRDYSIISKGGINLGYRF